MKIGRNDPCSCGSGKKYKKCCIEKELEAKPQPETEIFPDDDAEQLDEVWEAFCESDFETKIALFMKTIDTEEPPDNTMIFDILSEIRRESLERNERNRFDDLLETLHDRWPEVYAEDAHWFLKWRMQNALADGRAEAIPSLVNAMAERAGDDIDVFNQVLDMLLYHGLLPVIVDAMRIARPLVQNSTDIIPYGIDEFIDEQTDYILFNHVEQNGSLDTKDLNLLKQLGVYEHVNLERLSKYQGYLADHSHFWTMADFDLECRHVKHDDLHCGRQKLYCLVAEFVGYLRREENIPYTKGDLARKEILLYLFRRKDGELDPRENMFEAVMRESEGRPKPKRKPTPPIHPLGPDRETLECHLTGLLDFINPQQYKAAALFEMIPGWLRFLKLKNLMETTEQEKILNDLEKLIPDLRKLWEEYPDDPALLAASGNWREPAEKQKVAT